MWRKISQTTDKCFTNGKKTLIMDHFLFVCVGESTICQHIYILHTFHTILWADTDVYCYRFFSSFAIEIFRRKFNKRKHSTKIQFIREIRKFMLPYVNAILPIVIFFKQKILVKRANKNSYTVKINSRYASIASVKRKNKFHTRNIR